MRTTLASALVLLGCAVLGCNTDTGVDHPNDSLHFPVGVVADPAGDYIYVVNSNFDLAYKGGNVVAIDTRTHEIVPGSAVMVPSFGGLITALERDGRASRLYLASRDGDAMTWIQVGRDPETNAPVLTCWETPPDEAPACSGVHVRSGAGADVFGVALKPPTADGGEGYLFTTSFQGRISVFPLNSEGDPERDTIEFEDTVAGLYQPAIHPLTGQVYSTSKFSNLIVSVDVAREPDPEQPEDKVLKLSFGNPVVVVNPTTGRDFGRGMAFNQDGTLAFVAYRTPPSLVVVDMTLDDNGEAKNRVIDSIPLADGPAAVAVAPSGPGGRELVYVTIFQQDKVYVVDPKLSEVVDIIEVGDAPFDIAIVKRDGLFRAYVSLFESSAIGVIELDDGSPFYHYEIARIP